MLIQRVRLNNFFHSRSKFFSDASHVVSTTKVETKVKIPRKKKITDIEKGPLNIFIAIDKIKEYSWARFDETVDLIINTSLDPRKPNQSVRGMAKLPHGSGKKIRIAVFAKGDDAKLALDAGADIVGAEDLVAIIQSGVISFDRAIATPESMPLLGKLGKVKF